MPTMAYTTCANTAGTTAATWQAWHDEWDSIANTAVTWTNWVVCESGTTTGTIWADCARTDVPAVQDTEAKKRAEEILHRHLTEEQRAQLARDQFFVVQGSAGRTYRVKHGRAGNVEQLDEKGRPVERLCAHPAIYCPDEDTMLAQKLALEADEESFRRIANKTRLAA